MPKPTTAEDMIDLAKQGLEMIREMEMEVGNDTEKES
jgi:hypothetical protein